MNRISSFILLKVIDVVANNCDIILGGKNE